MAPCKKSLAQPPSSLCPGPGTSWRLIPPVLGPGRLQMAIDYWLLEQHRQGEQCPTLRFYTWQQPTISLGYHQRRWPTAWEHLTWAGQAVELVRRPTGGRAVLHQGDLTYSLVTSGLGSANRRAAYRYLCQFLLQGWRSLGLDLSYGQQPSRRQDSPNCFETATGADLLTPTGEKLVGSAQLWCDRTVLQHGSMRLRPDPALYQQVFDQPLHSPQLPSQLTQLATPDLHQEIMKALSTAAAEQLGAELVVQTLSAAELAAAAAADRLNLVPPNPASNQVRAR
jgi:lipoate-protein ligase A